MASFPIQHGLLVALIAFHAIAFTAPVTASSRKPKTPPPSIPIIIEIKKTIVFLDSECQHNYNDDLPTLSREKLLQMPPELQEGTLTNLRSAIARLNTIKLSH